MTTITPSEPSVKLIDVLRFLLKNVEKLSPSEKVCLEKTYYELSDHGRFSKTQVNILMGLFVQLGGWSFKIEDSAKIQETLNK